MREDERGQLYLLTGLVMGVIMGLVYAWVLQPIRYVDTVPASLRPAFKNEYRALIAAAYLGNQNLPRARARLELLQDADVFQALSGQAQRTLADNGPSGEARALGVLAIALGQAPPGPGVVITQAGTGGAAAPPASAAAPPEAATLAPTFGAPADPPSPTLPSSPTAVLAQLTDTPEAPAETPTPTGLLAPTLLPTETSRPRPTFTPTRTRQPSATPGAPFLLLSKDKQCEPPLTAPLIAVEALSRFNQPMSGVLVIVSWPGGEERFYTGLKPEMGAGYADFSPMPGVLYTLRVGENGEPEENLAALVCVGTGGQRYWGAWVLRFIQP